MDSLISVTSSGRSSIKRTITFILGLVAVILLAICFNNVVFPVFGWETIIPRCPFPIGERRSTIRMDNGAFSVSRLILSFGKIGVRSSKFFLFAASNGLYPLTDCTYSKALYFSFCVLIRIFPTKISPVFKLKRRIWDGET